MKKNNADTRVHIIKESYPDTGGTCNELYWRRRLGGKGTEQTKDAFLGAAYQCPRNGQERRNDPPFLWFYRDK